MSNRLSPEDKIVLANALLEHTGWQFFCSEMKRIMELKAAEINSAYSKNESYGAAYAQGFRMGIEAALTFPEKTIRINQPMVTKAKNLIEEMLGN